jgi:hypothetical protein
LIGAESFGVQGRGWFTASQQESTMPLTADDLAVDFFPQVGFADDDTRTRAWEDLRTAVQALALLGERGAPTAPLHWSHEDAGWLATATGPAGDVIGWLDFGAASLWIERRDPQEGAWIELAGKSPADIAAWVVQTSDRLAGRDTEGANTPDIVSESEKTPLAEPDNDALADLEAIYEGAGLILNALRDAADRLGHKAGQPTLDPTTLNATLHIGELLVGMNTGLDQSTQPHWFAAPADESPTHDDAKRSTLAIAEYIHLDSGEDQHKRIAAFIAERCSIALR